jgi:hypothetical protein
MEEIMENEKREIKLRRALILGNFYDQKVRIIKMINGVQEAVVDVVVGIQQDIILTKSGATIPVSSIRSIYQL